MNILHQKRNLWDPIFFENDRTVSYIFLFIHIYIYIYNSAH